MTKKSLLSLLGLQSSRTINFLIVIGAGLFALLLSIRMVFWTEQRYIEELQRQGNERLELYAATVQQVKKRYDYLPFIVAGDTQVKGLLNGQTFLGDEVNHKLQNWQQESNAAALYLMDKEGLVLASSNWDSRDSFINNNYRFRPYFIDAMQGRQGQFFAVGVTTGKPGLFLSRPIIQNRTVIGVAVVKIDMTALEQDWSSGGENILVADQDGVIFLASNQNWKYKSLTTPSNETLQRLKAARKYHDYKITPLSDFPLDKTASGQRLIKLPQMTPRHNAKPVQYLMHQRQLRDLNWSLYYLSNLQSLTEKKRNVIFVSILVAVLMALVAFIVIGKLRVHQLLEQRVITRTKALNEINNRLLEEIQQRIDAEQQLHQIHEELIQAEKLAALGQMSASLVHEINQPLTAMQTFAASTRLLLDKEDTMAARENIQDIEAMIRRVTTIVSHLKSFARKSQGQSNRVALNEVIDNALLLLKPRLKKSTVQLNWQAPDTPLYVLADEIKLEQILINLLRNALDSMQEQDNRSRYQLDIELFHENGCNCITVRDNGMGIRVENLKQLFEPFFTTKLPGQGLGLGLSVSKAIAEEFGGELEAIIPEQGGMLFKLSLKSME